MQKMKLYIISGLGADFKVLEKLRFPDHLNVQFLDWIIPENDETFSHYVERFTEKIDDSEPFALLGYSFGGIVAQEIHRKKPAQKVVILGSMRSDKEKSRFMKAGEISSIPKYLPITMFNERTFKLYGYVRKLIDAKNPKLLQYFTVRDPYYLKWSIDQISRWKGEEDLNVIQIMGDRDIVFPISKCHPNYIIKGGTHLFPTTKHKEVSLLLEKIFKENAHSEQKL